jgi:hypothetical protein
MGIGVTPPVRARCHSLVPRAGISWFAAAGTAGSLHRMAETGEKYTVARREVIAEHDLGRPPVVLRVYLNPHVG